jgi:hypothetical protein
MTLVLDVPPALEATLQTNAQARGVTLEQYIIALMERETFVPAPPPSSENWTLQDALDYAGPPPENLGRACAVASQAVLKRIWDNPKDDAAWPAS